MLQRRNLYLFAIFLLHIVLSGIAVALSIWLRTHVQLGMPYIPDASISHLYFVAPFIYSATLYLLSFYNTNGHLGSADRLRVLISGYLAGSFLVIAFTYFFARDISRLLILYFFAFEALALVLTQVISNFSAKWLVSSAEQRRVLVIGDNEAIVQAIERLRKDAGSSIELVGYLSEVPPTPLTESAFALSTPTPHLGSVQYAHRVIEQQNVSDIVLATPLESYFKRQELIATILRQGCRVWAIPSSLNTLLYTARIDDLNGVSMISMKSLVLSGYQRSLKRAFDMVVSASLLLMLSLPMILVAILIKLTSRGPVFYKQQRVGENGQLFGMFKFRSMVVNADRKEQEMVKLDASGKYTYEKVKGDARVTPLGRLLRRYSVDELPQLLNVLNGDMSLVGPRPELPALYEHYEPWQHRRLAVPQGMTGWWQVNGRSDKPSHMKIEDDLYYVQNYSLLLDFKILLKTLLVVANGKGAY